MLEQDIETLQAILRRISRTEVEASEEVAWLDNAYTGVQRAIASLELLANARAGIPTSAYSPVRTEPLVVREAEGTYQNNANPFEAIARGMVEGMAGTAMPDVEVADDSVCSGVPWLTCEWVEVVSCVRTGQGVDEGDRLYEVYELTFHIKLSNAQEPEQRVYEIPVYRAEHGRLEIGDWQVLSQGDADETN